MLKRIRLGAFCLLASLAHAGLSERTVSEAGEPSPLVPPNRSICFEVCEIDGTPRREASWIVFRQAGPTAGSQPDLACERFDPDGQGRQVGTVPKRIDVGRSYRIWVGADDPESFPISGGTHLTRDPFLARAAEITVEPLVRPLTGGGPRDLGSLRLELPEPVVDLWVGLPGSTVSLGHLAEPGPLGHLAEVEVRPFRSDGGYSGPGLTPRFEGHMQVPGRLRLYGWEPDPRFPLATAEEWLLWVRVPGHARLRRQRLPVGQRVFDRLERTHPLEVRIETAIPPKWSRLVLLSREPRSVRWSATRFGPSLFPQTLPWRDHLLKQGFPSPDRRVHRWPEVLEGEYVLELLKHGESEPIAMREFDLRSARVLVLE